MNVYIKKDMSKSCGLYRPPKGGGIFEPSWENIVDDYNDTYLDLINYQYTSIDIMLDECIGPFLKNIIKIVNT